MLQGKRICVVIPVYKAERHIQNVISSLPDFIDKVVAVNDCSPDSSLQKLQEINDPRLMIVSTEKNSGVGGAMKCGYKIALQGSSDIFVKMDSDGQMDPDQLPALVAPILTGKANYTKGNRFLHVRELQSMPLLRRIGNLSYSFLTKMATGYWNIFDPANGYTAIDRAALSLIDIEGLSNDYFFETSMLAALYQVRAVVQDVSIPARYRDEKSNLSEAKVLTSFPGKLFKVFFERIHLTYFMTDFNATSVFLIIGVLSILFGLIWGIYYWIKSAQLGIAASTGTVMIAAMPIILGIQLLLQAIVMDIQNFPKEVLED